MLKPLNLYIDHTLLKPEATWEEIQKLCEESIKYQFALTCIQPTWVKEASKFLNGTGIRLCSVVGFPLGATTTQNKAHEAHQLAEWGVQEIDMVINIGALKSKDYKKVRQDIEAVVHAASSASVKVILEVCLLNYEEKCLASLLSVEAGAAFVKTSTGFSKSGAKVEDIALLKKTVGPDFGVKASGGIRDLPTALTMINAGATRLGTSASVSIMQAMQNNIEQQLLNQK